MDTDGNIENVGPEPEVELVIRRDKVHKKKIITILFTSVLAVALALMGLDIEIDIVIKTMKVRNMLQSGL